MKRAVIQLLLLGLLVVNGLHLPAFQLAAWAGMLVAYSRNATLVQAIEMTFDGNHPCPMCEAIQKQRVRQDGEITVSSIPQRVDWVMELYRPWIPVMSCLGLLEDTLPAADTRVVSPEVPPPRLAA